MNAITINMSQGNVEHNLPTAVEYDDEILNSGWNPVVGLAQLVPEKKTLNIPDGVGNSRYGIISEKNVRVDIMY